MRYAHSLLLTTDSFFFVFSLAQNEPKREETYTIVSIQRLFRISFLCHKIFVSCLRVLWQHYCVLYNARTSWNKMNNFPHFRALWMLALFFLIFLFFYLARRPQHELFLLLSVIIVKIDVGVHYTLHHQSIKIARNIYGKSPDFMFVSFHSFFYTFFFISNRGSKVQRKLKKVQIKEECIR